MATARQKAAARRNLEKARQVQSERARGAKIAPAPGMSTAEKDRLRSADFAFPEKHKEPLVDAPHVRSAIARFDQVEGVSVRERDEAWKRIKSAARRFDVDVAADDWRELFPGRKAPEH